MSDPDSGFDLVDFVALLDTWSVDERTPIAFEIKTALIARAARGDLAEVTVSAPHFLMSRIIEALAALEATTSELRRRLAAAGI